jgi:membrane protease YdiL (CAAX protease family)
MDARHLLQRLVGPLQRSPGLRGTVYLGTAAALMQTIGGWFDQDYPTKVALVHLTILPMGAAVTAAGLVLEGRSPTELLPTPEERRQLLQGVATGAAVYLGVLAIMGAKGWASAPKWGWEDAPAGEVLRTTALRLVGHLAVAWNEEQVFRGYGFETLQQSIGTAGSSAVLVPLFASAHPFIPSVLLSTGIAGVLFTAQRLSTGNIWFGVGYHWAWNAMQSALFGPADAAPALRPLRVHGPERWVGQPGYPESGLLVNLIDLAGLAAMGAVWWRWRLQSGQRQEKD